MRGTLYVQPIAILMNHALALTYASRVSPRAKILAT